MGLEEPSYFADYIGDYNVLVGPMLYKNNAEYNAVMDSDIVKRSECKTGKRAQHPRSGYTLFVRIQKRMYEQGS